MDEVIHGFVPITAVAKEYSTSRKSVERRRDKARSAGDSTVYRQFRLRTKDGETLDEPTLDKVKQLRADGRVPEWFVAREWLEQTFGKRGVETQEGSEPSPKPDVDSAVLENHPYVRLLKTGYESRIADLQGQLQAGERREERMTKLIESVNDTTKALNQTLALPGIAKAARAQREPTVDGRATEKQQPAKPNKDESESRASAPRKNTKKKKEPERRKWLGRLWK